MDEAIKRRVRMLDKAESNLEGIVDIGTDDKETLKVVADVSKFIVKTQGKDNGWSERTEHTGKDGKDLIPIPILNGILSDDSDKTDSGDEAPH